MSTTSQDAKQENLIYVFSAIVFLIAFGCSYYFNLNVGSELASNLVTFFSLIFGFYMSIIAIVFNSSYITRLYMKKDKEKSERGTHKLERYLLLVCYWAIFSIVSIIFYRVFATVFDNYLNWQNWVSHVLIAVSCVNIYYVALFIKLVISLITVQAQAKIVDDFVIDDELKKEAKATKEQ